VKVNSHYKGIFLISFVSSFAFNLHKKYYTKFRLEFQLYK